MLKLLSVGSIGICASFAGLWLNHHLKEQDQAKTTGDAEQTSFLQVKTEMTGVPVVINGEVSGYLVFQISSTVDTSKLATKEFDVAPYLLDAAIRASYRSTEDGTLNFNAVYLERLSDLVRDEANRKLPDKAVIVVNVQQFNFVPKGDVRGNVLAGSQKQ
jgi:hypothetical protein